MWQFRLKEGVGAGLGLRWGAYINPWHQEQAEKKENRWTQVPLSRISY